MLNPRLMLRIKLLEEVDTSALSVDCPVEVTPSASGCGVSGKPGEGAVPCKGVRGWRVPPLPSASGTWAHPQCVIMHHSPPAARAAALPGPSPPGEPQDTWPGTSNRPRHSNTSWNERKAFCASRPAGSSPARHHPPADQPGGGEHHSYSSV